MIISAERLSELACNRTVCIVKPEERIQLAQRVLDAEANIAELTEFLAHVKKCLVRDGEYSPLTHERIDRLLDIAPK